MQVVGGLKERNSPPDVLTVPNMLSKTTFAVCRVDVVLVRDVQLTTPECICLDRRMSGRSHQDEVVFTVSRKWFTSIIVDPGLPVERFVAQSQLELVTSALVSAAVYRIRQTTHHTHPPTCC